MTRTSPVPRLTDTPWFWLMLFGCVASLGVVAIAPKHAARQARLERMARTRQQVAAAREAGVPAAAVKRDRAGDAAATSGPIEPYVEDDFAEPPHLTWLLSLSVSLMLAGTAGMWFARRRAPSAIASGSDAAPPRPGDAAP